MKLDRRITIQAATVGDDAYDTRTWGDLVELWANVQTEGPHERIRANRIESSLAYIITIRYRDDVTSAMRILYEGKTLHITGPPMEIERREYLEIMALYEG